MAAEVDFSFSDSTSGYVVERQGRQVVLRTTDDRRVTVHLTDTTHGQRLRNLGRPYEDVSGRLYELLTPGRFVFCYGPLYPDAGGLRFQASQLVFVTDDDGRWPFERPAGGPTSCRRSPTSTAVPSSATGRSTSRIPHRDQRQRRKDRAPRQETDTISRLVYGLAAAYLLTGEDRWPRRRRAREYLRDHMRFVDADEDSCTGTTASTSPAARERKILASEFGDDYDAIPAYEQIYALAGPTQTLPAHRRPRILSDIEATISLFDRFFRDRDAGRLLLPRRPGDLRPAGREPGPQPGPQELELGRRPRARVPDQRSAWRPATQRPADLLETRATPSPSTSPTTRTARSSRRGSTRTGATTTRGAGSRTAPSWATT